MADPDVSRLFVGLLNLTDTANGTVLYIWASTQQNISSECWP